MTIAQVTTKRLAGATFTGGPDCMWLAAVAEWVFSLDVVIYNSAGVLLYRSRSPDERRLKSLSFKSKKRRNGRSRAL